MSIPQESNKTEAENSFRTAKQDYEMGEALLDLLETAIQGVEQHVARASTSSRDDMRRLMDHTLRVRELALRLLEIRNTLDNQLAANTSPKPASHGKH